MKRGSSQGKWGNVSPTHSYTYACPHMLAHLTYVHIRTVSVRARIHRAPVWRACTKTAGFGRKLTPFPTFHSVHCFSLRIAAMPHYTQGISVVCHACPRVRFDFERLRYRRSARTRQLREVNWTLSRQTVRHGEITSQLFSFGSRAWMAGGIERVWSPSIADGYIHPRCASAVAAIVFLPRFFIAPSVAVLLEIVKELDPFQRGHDKERNIALVFYQSVVCDRLRAMSIESVSGHCVKKFDSSTICEYYIRERVCVCRYKLSFISVILLFNES